MKKILILVVAILIFSTASTGCEHTHEWEPATCMTPRTCIDCGETEGKTSRHSWAVATCTDSKSCEKCGITDGEALGHSWAAATCTNPKSCEKCGITDGEALGHSWAAATCTNPKSCEKCGITDGKALGHSWTEATCANPKSCTNCGATNGSALGHSWVASSVYSKNCKVCGAEEIDQSKLPVKLGSLKPCAGPNYSSTENKSDIYGNTFSEGLLLWHEGWSTGDHQGAEYVLNREYKTFTAKVLIDSLSRNDFEVNLKIYVDGVLAYDSGVMTKKTQPVDISVDISNAMFIKIETNKTGVGGTVMISDPLLHH